MLTALGLVPPDGHRRVLDAANQLDKNPRFYWILKELWAASCILSFIYKHYILFYFEE